MDEPKPRRKISVVVNHCHRCLYDWRSKGKSVPKSCPRCKSYTWQSPVVEKGTLQI